MRLSGKNLKQKNKIRNETSAPVPYNVTSDDIWMKNWGYDSEGMFEGGKEAVSDPEEYLINRSDEDVLFPSHNVEGDTATVTVINTEPEDLLPTPRAQEDYVESIEFNECVKRGLFCKEHESMPVIHYHCPCCIKHSETALDKIEIHYRECAAAMSSRNALFTSICKHDVYITFQECSKTDVDCPAHEVRLPIHYHCPCCLIFTQQSIAQVVRHQISCCKTLSNSMLQQTSQFERIATLTPIATGMCTHPEDMIRYKICFRSYCLQDAPPPAAAPSISNLRKFLHFHCTCCNFYIDTKIRTLRKHQRVCCVYSQYSTQERYSHPPKVVFLLETSLALEQHRAVATASAKRKGNKLEHIDAMAMLATRRKKVQKKASEVLAEIDDSLFSKCMDGSSIYCNVNERYRRAHFHCPACNVYTSRRLSRVKLHYNKCTTPKRRAKPRGQPLDLQCELVDKLNRVFLVRGGTQGPGVPCHVIYRAGPNSSLMHCDYGCKMDKVVGKVRCKHLEACEFFVRNSDDLKESGGDAPPLHQISMFYTFDENMKKSVYLLSQTCEEHRVPIIRPFYPSLSSTSKSNFTYYSVSTCSTPSYVSRAQRVVVTYDEKCQVFKCKCGGNPPCVHILAAQLYQSHFVINSMLCEETIGKTPQLEQLEESEKNEYQKSDDVVSSSQDVFF